MHVRIYCEQLTAILRIAQQKLCTILDIQNTKILSNKNLFVQRDQVEHRVWWIGAEDGQVCIWGIAPYHRKMPHKTTVHGEFVHMFCTNLLLLHLSEGESSGLMYSMKITKHLFPYSIDHLFSPESLVLTHKYPYSHRMMYNCIEGQRAVIPQELQVTFNWYIAFNISCLCPT